MFVVGLFVNRRCWVNDSFDFKMVQDFFEFAEGVSLSNFFRNAIVVLSDFDRSFFADFYFFVLHGDGVKGLEKFCFESGCLFEQ